MVKVITAQQRQKAVNLQQQTQTRLRETNERMALLQTQKTLRQSRGIGGLLKRQKVQSSLSGVRSSLENANTYYKKIKAIPTREEYVTKLKMQEQNRVAKLKQDIRSAEIAMDRGIPTSFLKGDVYKLVKKARKIGTLQKEKYYKNPNYNYYVEVKENINLSALKPPKDINLKSNSPSRSPPKKWGWW